MNVIVRNIKWIMFLSGVITCSTFFAVIAPQAALLSMFGSDLTEPLANLVARSWGFLVSIMGILLIYGAFNEDARMLCIITAVVFDTIVALTLATYVVSPKIKTMSVSLGQ